MSSIKLRKNAYTEYETTRNWSRKYAEREIEKHRMAGSLDHADGSVEVKHLSQGVVDLIREIPEGVSQGLEALKSGKLDNWKPIQLNADIDNIEDGFYYFCTDDEVEAVSETANLPMILIQKTAYKTYRVQIKISAVSGGGRNAIYTRNSETGNQWSDWTAYATSDDVPVVVDNLTSYAALATLSANQGRVLKEMLDTKMDEWKPIPVAGEIGEQYSDYDNLEDGFYYDVHFSRTFLIQCTSNNTRIQLKAEYSDLYIRCRDEGQWWDWRKLNNPTPIDNLASTSAALPLSANQGRVLKEMIDNIGTPTSQTLSPEMHRVTFRGKNLGSTVTAEQKTAIANGTFDDLFLGDYWVINDIVWRIVDMDYWYNTGTAINKDTHHIVIMPDRNLYDTRMHSSSSNSCGYVGSEMYTTNLNQAKTTITSIFGDMLITHKEFLTNSVKDGVIAGLVEKDSCVELPSEIMIYGTRIMSDYGDLGVTYSKTQLALFDVAPKYIYIGDYYWLRDPCNSYSFARISYDGYASTNDSDFLSGVRPVFAIKGE